VQKEDGNLPSSGWIKFFIQPKQDVFAVFWLNNSATAKSASPREEESFTLCLSNKRAACSLSYLVDVWHGWGF